MTIGIAGYVIVPQGPPDPSIGYDETCICIEYDVPATIGEVRHAPMYSTYPSDTMAPAIPAPSGGAIPIAVAEVNINPQVFI
jgi:hypothetical protein